MVRITIVLILAMLAMETLASPLNLEVSIQGVQNGNTTKEAAGGCIEEFGVCQNDQNNCCNGLVCDYDTVQITCKDIYTCTFIYNKVCQEPSLKSWVGSLQKKIRNFLPARKHSESFMSGEVISHDWFLYDRTYLKYIFWIHVTLGLDRVTSIC